MSPIFFNKINALLVVIDLQNKIIVWANDYYFRTTGNQKDYGRDIPLDSFIQTIHPHDRDGFMNTIEKYGSSKTIGQTLIYRIKTKSAGWLWVFSHFSKYEMPKNGVVYFVNYATEIDCSGLRRQLVAIFDEDNDCFKHELMNILTNREKEIFDLIVHGNTNKEISAMLNISIHTTKTHRKRIIHKMGLKNSTILIKTAIEHGMN